MSIPSTLQQKRSENHKSNNYDTSSDVLWEECDQFGDRLGCQTLTL